MDNSTKMVIEALEQQADGITYRINVELRKARKCQTEEDKLFYETRAQVLRKQLRAVREHKFSIIDSVAA